MLHCNGIDPFVTLMGNFNWGPISRNDIVSRSDPDQTAPNYEQTDQGLHRFAIPPASFTGICIHCDKKER